MLSKLNAKHLLSIASSSASATTTNQRIICSSTILKNNVATQLNIQQKEINTDTEWNQAQPFEKIPGPTRFEMLKGFLPGGKYNGLAILDLHRKLRSDYGPIAKFRGVLGKPDIIISFNPSDHEKMFRNEGTWPTREGFDTFAYYRQHVRSDIFKGNGGLLSEQGENWHTTRTKVNPVMLPPKIVKMYIPHVDSVAKDFIDMIKPTRDGNHEVPANFGHELNKWSLESIGYIALDQRLGVFNEERNPEARRIIAAVRSIFLYAYQLDVLPSPWRYYKTSTFKKLMAAFDEMTSLIMKNVDAAVKRLEANPTKITDGNDSELSVLEKLLKIDRHVAVVMATDMLMAGIDTTSAATVGCLYHLAKHPEKQEILRKEIHQTLPDRNTDFSPNSFNNMPYMRGVFKEAMRLSPVVAGNLRGAGKDMVLQGYKIPKGTNVAMASVVLQQEPEYFPKPDEFIPERWLKDNEHLECPSAKTANPFVYLPFGFGARSCIGRRFAEMEVQVLLARIVQNFKIEYNYGPIKYVTGLIQAPTGDLKFKLTDI